MPHIVVRIEDIVVLRRANDGFKARVMKTFRPKTAGFDGMHFRVQNLLCHRRKHGRAVVDDLRRRQFHLVAPITDGAHAASCREGDFDAGGLRVANRVQIRLDHLAVASDERIIDIRHDVAAVAAEFSQMSHFSNE